MAGSLPLYFFGILLSITWDKLQLHTIFFSPSQNKAQVFFSLSGLAEALGIGFHIDSGLLTLPAWEKSGQFNHR